MKHVKIERLNLRLRGVSPHNARAAVNGLGLEILSQLADQRSNTQVSGSHRLDELHIGKIRLNQHASLITIRTRLAREIGNAILSRLE